MGRVAIADTGGRILLSSSNDRVRPHTHLHTRMPRAGRRYCCHWQKVSAKTQNTPRAIPPGGCFTQSHRIALNSFELCGSFSRVRPLDPAPRHTSLLLLTSTLVRTSASLLPCCAAMIAELLPCLSACLPSCIPADGLAWLLASLPAASLPFNYYQRAESCQRQKAEIGVRYIVQAEDIDPVTQLS
ncbi:hypothetical protein Maes01_01449 [Microbulbifer aestuariivivens]|uniref:Uncharacterized protein n=1 Tax=Microbulbifer aestuariivivens TaxID=1908308 RepID=A0ABP9WRN7_9GAMM